jgi:hypothetical protein
LQNYENSENLSAFFYYLGSPSPMRKMVNKKRSAWKTTFYILLTLIVTLFVTAYVMMLYWEPIVREGVKKAVSIKTKGLYQIELGKVNVNLLLGRVVIKDIVLTPVDSVYKDLKIEGKQPVYLYGLQVQRLLIRGLDLASLIKENKIYVGKIEVDKPKIQVLEDQSITRENRDTSRFRNPYDLIQGTIKSLVIEQIAVEDIKLNYKIDSLGIQREKNYNLNYVRVKNFKLDSASAHSKESHFFSDDIRVSIKNFENILPDKQSKFLFEELTISTGSKSIDVYNFRVSPMVSEHRFADSLGYRKLRLQLYAKEVHLKGVKFSKLFVEKRFIADQILVKTLDIKMQQNRKREVNPNKVVLFPQELFKKIKLPFFITNGIIKDAKLSYVETVPKGNSKWALVFDHLNATLSNIGNDQEEQLVNNKLHVDLNSKLNGMGKVQAKMAFDYLDKQRSFNLQGKISNMKLQNFNSIIQNFAPLEIGNCNLKSLEFNMNGNESSMFCKLKMIYNNLRVTILRHDDAKGKLTRSNLFSALANTAILNNDNPSANGKFVQPAYRFDREEKVGFWSFVWKSMFEGIKESIGFSHKMEMEVKKMNTRYKEFKEMREKRKVLRLQRKKEQAITKEQEVD